MLALPPASEHRWWHSLALLLTTGTLGFCLAFIVGQVLIVVFCVSPSSLGGVATFGPGSDALGKMLKGPLGPTPRSDGQSKLPNPVLEEAAQRLAREILWLRSPWRFAVNNAVVIIVTTVFTPWMGVLLAARSKNAKNRDACLWAFLLMAPVLFHLLTEARFGLWTSAELIGSGHFRWGMLRHTIPELGAFLLSALVPLTYYLRHVRSSSSIRFSAYTVKHLGIYGISGVLVVLAAFIEAGRLWK